MTVDGPLVEHWVARVMLNGIIASEGVCPNVGEAKQENIARGTAISLAQGNFMRTVLAKDVRDAAPSPNG